MNIMHFLAKGEAGGIESLCRDYANCSNNKNVFVFLKGVNSVNALKIQEAGHPVIELNYSPYNLIRTLHQIKKCIKSFSIDTIVVHHSSPTLYILVDLIRGRKQNIKVIAYAHCLADDMLSVNESNKKTLKDKIIIQSFKKSNKVIAISKAVKKSLIECMCLPEGKIRIVYNGVDINSFSPKEDYKINSPVTLIYVGRLVKEKGVQNILFALSKLSVTCDNWVFDIVGDGDFRSELEEYTKRLDLVGKVHFLGVRDDIPQILKEHDVFVHMPAYEEGFGIAIIEAMAAGLLCICGGRGGIPEIIENGSSGILVNSNQELMDTLESLLMNRNIKKFCEIRNNGIKRANDFNIWNFSKQLDEQIMSI